MRRDLDLKPARRAGTVGGASPGRRRRQRSRRLMAVLGVAGLVLILVGVTAIHPQGPSAASTRAAHDAPAVGPH